MKKKSGVGKTAPDTNYVTKAVVPAKEASFTGASSDQPTQHHVERIIRFLEGLPVPLFRIAVAMLGLMLFLAWFKSQVIQAMEGK